LAKNTVKYHKRKNLQIIGILFSKVSNPAQLSKGSNSVPESTFLKRTKIDENLRGAAGIFEK
jgi:hypothetical protein